MNLEWSGSDGKLDSRSDLDGLFPNAVRRAKTDNASCLRALLPLIHCSFRVVELEVGEAIDWDLASLAFKGASWGLGGGGGNGGGCGGDVTRGTLGDVKFGPVPIGRALVDNHTGAEIPPVAVAWTRE